MRILLSAIATALAANVALAADLGQPVVAPPSLSPRPAAMGYGEFSLGWTGLDFANRNSWDGLFTFSGGGYLNLPFAERWNLEVEARGYSIDRSGDQAASDFGGFAHLYWRDPERLAIGGFAGYTALGLYGMHGDMLTAGAEAQAYLGNLTLYGQAAGFTSSASSGWLYFDGYFVRGAARYFATPNLRLQFDAQWAAIDNSDHTEALSLVGTAEYRFADRPLSAFARVRWDRLNPDLNQDMDTTMFLFGIRGYFGGDTLFGNDRWGAPMDVLPFPTPYALNFG